jgi:4-alpha-glucanotransferase
VEVASASRAGRRRDVRTAGQVSPARRPAPAAEPFAREPPAAGGRCDPALAALAARYGVAVAYADADHREIDVAPGTVRAVLALLGVDTADPAASLAAAEDDRWRRLLPPSAVVRGSRPAPVIAHVPAGAAWSAELELADGRRLAVPAADPAADPADGTAGRTVDGVALVAVGLRLPAALPTGDHLLRLRAGTRSASTRLISVPDRVPPPAGGDRLWGWMAQLYAMRSAGSWGIGDYADLATLAAASGSAAGGGAGVLLVNPLHAAAPTLPVEASPYSPVSRRFASPLYLRPELTPEYAAADPAVRARVDDLARGCRAAGTAATPHTERIDRDGVWRAKLAALELLHRAADDPDPGDPAPDDAGLRDFATWCALAERHGPDWRRWPVPLRDPAGPAVARAREELADRIAFHTWLQRRCDDQLAAAQAAARAAGMPVGIVHDLAVGVDPGGADAWAGQDVFATGATVGAPPDTFNQQGQDWGLPPWRPDRLADTGYAPLRHMLRAVLGRGGGLRVDHILGVFRLWWIPAGAGAAGGTYVHYDADAILGIIALEAARTGALVVGEDLGTVGPTVAGMLADAGVLGSSILWFERDAAGDCLPPARWRRLAMASVSTHDLPTAAGFLAGEHVRVRAELGVLGRSEAAERAHWWRERATLLRRLAAEGLLPAGVPPAWLERVEREPAGGLGVSPRLLDEVVVAMHRLLAAAPSEVVLAAPGDAVGDLRQPNLPGTTDAYPNWRLPLADSTGRPVGMAEFLAHPATARIAAVLRPGSSTLG